MRRKGRINREDMLELTRRMTPARNCFGRIAGAYFDEEGYVEGTFNRHFQKLTLPERQQNLEIAKAIPFSETNAELKEYGFDADEEKPGGIRQMLMALNACELKNDALLETFYEILGEIMEAPRGPFAFYIFHGSYDVPRKGTDQISQWESEDVYSFLIGAFCAVDEEYNPEPPSGGFLFPAFRDRCVDDHSIEIFRSNG